MVSSVVLLACFSFLPYLLFLVFFPSPKLYLSEGAVPIMGEEVSSQVQVNIQIHKANTGCSWPHLTQMDRGQTQLPSGTISGSSFAGVLVVAHASSLVQQQSSGVQRRGPHWEDAGAALASKLHVPQKPLFLVTTPQAQFPVSPQETCLIPSHHTRESLKHRQVFTLLPSRCCWSVISIVIWRYLYSCHTTLSSDQRNRPRKLIKGQFSCKEGKRFR